MKNLNLKAILTLILLVCVSISRAGVCPNTATTFNAQAGMISYTWSDGLGTNSSVTVYPSVTKTYTCTEMDENLNVITESFTVTVLSATDPLCQNTGGGSGGPMGAVTTCAGSSVTFNAQAGMISYTWDGGLGTSASVTVFPATTTTYTCTETDLFGGTVTESFTVVVLSASDPLCTNGGGGGGGGTGSGGSTGVTTCAGSGVTFNAQSGMISYSWDNGLGTSASVTIFPTVSTSYTCTETDFSGTIFTETFDVTVLAANDPQCINGGGGTDTGGGGGTVTTPTDTIKACSGDIITLTADANQLLYIWDNNLDGSQIQRVSPTVSTTYTVTMLPLSGGATTSHIYYVEVLASTDPLCSTGTGSPCTTKSGKVGTVDCGIGSSGKSGKGTACTCKVTTSKPSTVKPNTSKPSTVKPGKGNTKSGKKRSVEIQNTKLIKIFNSMGQEVNADYPGIKFYIYDNGSCIERIQ